MSEVLETQNWTKEQVLYLHAYDFLSRDESNIEPPQFDWRNHNEADVVRRAMRDYFGEGLTPEAQQRYKRLNLALNPQSHHQENTVAEDEISRAATYETQGSALPSIAPMSTSKAACGRENPNHFFYDGKPTVKEVPHVEAAKRICASCVKKEECLDWGRRHHKLGYAIHGGFLLGPGGGVAAVEGGRVVNANKQLKRKAK